MIVTYAVTVWVTRTVDPEDSPARYTSAIARRQLEKEVLRNLTRLDGDCDCECMSAELGEE